MLGNIAGFPNRVQWSSFNSPATSWTPARLTQAGYADLTRSFGTVQRIVGGRFPIVFQERGVQRVESIEPPIVHRFTPIEDARGCLAPFSVVTIGFVTYYLAQDGFWSTDGNSFQPIGTSRINKWFFENCAASKIALTHGTIDFENECIVWAFKTADATFDRLIRYSYSENRWSHARVSLDRLVETVLGEHHGPEHLHRGAHGSVPGDGRVPAGAGKAGHVAHGPPARKGRGGFHRGSGSDRQRPDGSGGCVQRGDDCRVGADPG
jgi:hypothetical protein